MAAHRGINPADNGPIHYAHEFVIERLPHTVKTLKLHQLSLTHHLQHTGHRVGIMAGKLGIKIRPGRQDTARAGQIGHIGSHLAGEDRISRQTQQLSAFDLAVPVSALDQTDGNPPPSFAGQRRQPVNHRQRPLLIGLHCQAQSLPAAQTLMAV